MPGCTLETIPKFTVHLSLSNPTFRLPDLHSAAKLYGFGLKIFHPWSTDDSETSEQETWDFVHSGRSAFIVIEFTDEDGQEVRDLQRCLRYCRQLGERCIMIKSVVLIHRIVLNKLLTKLLPFATSQIHTSAVSPRPDLARAPRTPRTDQTGRRPSLEDRQRGEGIVRLRYPADRETEVSIGHEVSLALVHVVVPTLLAPGS
jgi:hypothetical protein